MRRLAALAAVTLLSVAMAVPIGAAPAPAAQVSPPRFGFIAINVSDLASALSFYRDVLGMREQSRHETAEQVELGLDFGEKSAAPPLLLIVNKAHQGPYQGGERLSRIAFIVKDIDEVNRRLTAQGGKAADKPFDVKAFKVKVAFISDPDGNRIELIQPYD